MLIVYKVKIELTIRLVVLLLLERLKQVSDIVRGKCRLAKDTHNLKHWSVNLEVVFDDGNETICDDGDVYLYSYRIFRLTPESFDLEMLFDPFEKKLHLPSILVEESDFFRLEIEVVRIVDEASVQLRGIVDNAPDDTRILFLVRLFSEADTLIFEHVACTIEDALAVNNFILRLAFLSDDEEGTEHIDPIESSKVKVSSIKYIASQRLIREPIHRVDIMHLGIGNSVEYGYLSNDVNLSMDSDARLRASKLCPSEYGHAEVNGRGVNGIEPAVQFKLLSDASGLGHSHHVKSELLKDAMLSESIGLRQHLSVDWLVAKSEVFRLLSMGGCYICKFPETSAAHELAEHQNQQMVPMRHRPALGPVVVLGEYSPELPLREKLYYLCKNECPYMHICSDFESDAKVSISKPGQGIGGLKRCA